MFSCCGFGLSNECRFSTSVARLLCMLPTLQVLGLFFAFILRAISSSSRRDYDSDDDYMVPRSAPRQPANNRQANQAVPASSGPGTPAEARAPRTDAWSTRMREKVR